MLKIKHWLNLANFLFWIELFVPTEEEPTPDATPSATPKSAKLVGSTFFGPDFNIETYKGNVISSFLM